MTSDNCLRSQRSYLDASSPTESFQTCHEKSPSGHSHISRKTNLSSKTTSASSLRKHLFSLESIKRARPDHVNVTLADEVETGEIVDNDHYLSSRSDPPFDSLLQYIRQQFKKCSSFGKKTMYTLLERVSEQFSNDEQWYDLEENHFSHEHFDTHQFKTLSKVSKWPPPLPVIHHRKLLDQVFTHSSWAFDYGNQHTTRTKHIHNERLEFLGDSYFNHVVTRIVFARHPEWREGTMSKVRSVLVGNTMAEEFARAYKFEKRIKTNDRTRMQMTTSANSKLIADIFEAYIAGIILDSKNGLEIAQNWIFQLISPKLEALEEAYAELGEYNPMAKQDFYVLARKYYGPSLVVSYLQEDKFDIVNVQFCVSARVNGIDVGRGFGQSLKEAGARAAMKGIAHMNKLIRERGEFNSNQDNGSSEFGETAEITNRQQKRICVDT